jgi:hypothetical protein
MRMADNGEDKWATACIVYGDGGVDFINPFYLLVRQSHQAPRIVTVLVLLLVGIVRVQYLYLNPRICKYQIFSTDILSSVEISMHTNGFRYKKCTHFTVGTSNVYLNPG